MDQNHKVGVGSMNLEEKSKNNCIPANHQTACLVTMVAYAHLIQAS